METATRTRTHFSAFRSRSSSSRFIASAATSVALILVLVAFPPGTHSHWINLHVWYEDPLLASSETSSASAPGAPGSSSDAILDGQGLQNVSTLHGMMQQDQQEGQQQHLEPLPPQGFHGERQLPPCDQLHGLTQAQIDMCLVFRDHMKAIVNGAKLGLSECRYQFRFNHWNCSSPPNLNEYYQYSTAVEAAASAPEDLDDEDVYAGGGRNSGLGAGAGTGSNSVSIDSHTPTPTTPSSKKKGKGKNNSNGKTKGNEKVGKNKGKKTHAHAHALASPSASTTVSQAKTKKRSVFSQDLQDKLNQQFNSVWNSILKQGSKEVAFAHAVWSAAVTQSVARACREGSLTSCSCGRTPRPPDLKREWRWGGCGDNLQYGYKFASDFVDSREKAATDSKVRAKSLVNLHNNEAGRRAVLRKTKIACKCHGVSGSCALVTCWHQIPSFREIGDYLKESYSKATLVKMNKRGRLQVKKAGVPIPSVHDLLYVENSPNYCVENSTLGVFGQTGRICNPDSRGPDSCTNLCCSGKGYTTNTIRSSQRCHCKFVWCCSVQCQQCKSVQRVTSCN